MMKHALYWTNSIPRRLILFATILLAIVGVESVKAQPHEKTLGIAELIFEVRSELIKAEEMMKSAGRAPLFVTRKLDLARFMQRSVRA